MAMLQFIGNRISINIMKDRMNEVSRFFKSALCDIRRIISRQVRQYYPSRVLNRTIMFFSQNVQ